MKTQTTTGGIFLTLTGSSATAMARTACAVDNGATNIVVMRVFRKVLPILVRLISDQAMSPFLGAARRMNTLHSLATTR